MEVNVFVRYHFVLFCLESNQCCNEVFLGSWLFYQSVHVRHKVVFYCSEAIFCQTFVGGSFISFISMHCTIFVYSRPKSYVYTEKKAGWKWSPITSVSTTKGTNFSWWDLIFLGCVLFYFASFSYNCV